MIGYLTSVVVLAQVALKIPFVTSESKAEVYSGIVRGQFRILGNTQMSTGTRWDNKYLGYRRREKPSSVRPYRSSVTRRRQEVIHRCRSAPTVPTNR